MKKNFTLIFALLLCFFSIGASAQSQFWSDTFEDAGAPSSGSRTTSIAEFFNGGPPYTSYFLRTAPAQLNLQSGAYSGFQGAKIFAAEDIDKGPTNVNNSIPANQQVTWNNINIAGKTGLSFKGLFAANPIGAWQGSAWNNQSVSGSTLPLQDFLAFEYQIDGGPWVRAIAFYANLAPSDAASANTLQLETTGDLQGDGASLTYAFAEYSANIPGTGTILNIRMNCHANSTSTQEVAVDNFRLFETLGSAATVTTGGNTPSYTTASLAGTVNDNNSTTAVTFEYGLSTSYGLSVNGSPSSVTAGTGSTAITGSLTSLLPNTTYHYRIKGINGIGTSNGTDGTFTTLSLPTVTTAVPGTITTTSAVLGGNVTAAGSSAVTERGIVYSLTTNPTVANTKVQNGTGIGVFSATVSSFASNTLYYVKAYAINGGGPSYGAEQTFTTASSTITAGSTFPAGLTTTYGVTSSSTSIAVSGTNISAGITATPSSTANFEVSADDITYGPSATIGSSGTVSGTVYVRLKATAGANASIAGSVTLTSTGANSPVITIPTSSVAKATLTYTADQKAKIYGAVVPTLTGTVSGFVNSETVAVTTGTLSFTTAATLSSSVGSFAINGTGLTAANYSFVQAAGNATALTITQRPLTVTATGINKAYDGTTTATVTLGDNRVAGDVFTSSYTDASFATPGVGTNIAVSVNGIAITGGASANYTLGNTTASATANITAKAITIAANSGQSKSYGNGDPTITYTATPGLASGDSFTGALNRVAGENVNTYAIIQGNLSAGNNYTITFTPGVTFAITQRAITVTPNTGQSKVYGNVNPTLDYTIGGSGLAFADSFTGALSRAAGENVNTYAIAQGTLALSSNYAVTFTPGVTFAITQRPVTVTPNAGQSKIYGSINPTLTYSVGGSGLAFADTFTGALTRVTGENVGNYAITQGNLTLSSNYSVTFTSGVTFAITPKTLTVTATGINKAYDGTTVATVNLNDNRIAGDVFTESYASASFGTAAIGTNKPVSVTGIAITGGASANYTLGNTTAATTADITAGAIVITADAKSKIYGDNDPALTYTYTGTLVGTDAFSGSLTRVAGSNVGAYAINQGTLVLSNAGNYSITYNSANLSITPKTLTVTAAGNNKVYDGTTAATVNLNDNRVAGDVFTESYASAAFTTAAAGTNKPVSVTGIAITGGASANYTLGNTTAATTADITARAIVATADVKSKVYGAAEPTLTYTYTGTLVGTDNFTGSLSRVAGDNVGTYAINQGTLVLGSNYSLTYNTANLTITPKTLTVTATGINKAYDGTTAATVNLNDNRVAGDVFTESYAGASFATATIGTNKPVNVTGIAITGGASGNYTLGNTTAATTADITARAIVITADTKSKIYGSADPALTYTYTGTLVGTDAFSGSLTRVAGSNVGTYAINQGTLVLSNASNYNITYNSANLSITPKTLTVTATGINKIYDGTTAATVTLSDDRVAGDVFTESYASAAFTTAAAGTNKPVSVTGIAITGGASANYTLGNTTTATTADITARAIVVTADAKSKVYGAAEPTLTYTYTGTLIGTDAFTGSLSRVTGENVGAYAINQGTLALGSNYSLTYNTANLSITPKTLTVTATGISKAYDGTTAATVNLNDNRVAGDVFTESYASASFATATIGTNKPVNVTGIAITGGASGNYTLGNTTAATTADITARAIVITADTKSKIYGSADPSLTYTYTGTLVGTDAFSGSLTRVAGSNVGAYAINQGTLVLSNAGNYSITYNSANLSITPKTLTVTATGINKTYDGTTAATVTLSDDRVAGDVFTESYASAAFATATAGTNKPVSVAGIAITGGASANYTLGNTTTATTADITARAIVVTVDAKSKVYGSAEPTLTYTYTGTLIGTDAFTGALSRVTGENVGAYAINQGTLALSNNYSIAFNSADLTIGKKTVTVTAAAKSKTYGDADPALTYTFAPALVTGDSFTGSLTRAVGETIGTYAINQGTLALSTNYTLTYVGDNLTIGKKMVTVTAAAKSKTYGDADPALTYTFAPALVTGDSFTGSLTRAVGETIGTYAINQGTLALSTNYTLTYVGDNLTIGKKTVTVTAAAKSKTYGDADPALTYTFTPALVTGDSFTGSLTRSVGETIGTYGINQGTLALNTNYTLTYVGDNLTISKKTVTVTAAAKSKTYGDADPALTYTFAPALVTGDSFTGSLTRAVGETIGAYAINQGTLALNPNYTLTYVGDNLTIGKKTVTVTAAAKSKTYGDADPALTYTFAPALVTGDSFTGSLTRAVGETIGTYAINQGTLALNPNYTLTYVGDNLTIGKKTVTVTASAKSKTYGDADPALTYTFAPALVTGDSFTGSLTRAVGETIGTYVINQGTLALSTNYTLTYVGDNLTIGKKTVTVTAAAKSKTYGDADPALTYTFAPALVTGDSFTGSLTRAVGETIGTYAINQGTLALNANYTLTYVGDNLTIGKKTITVTAAAKSKTYGDADPALTYTFAPALVTGDTFSGSITRLTGENVGTYAITQGTLALNSNYTLTYVGANLTIGAKTVTVIAAAKSKTYGDADPALTYTFAPALVTGDSFSGNLTRAAGENAGTYAINQGTLTLGANYAITYVGANLTINKAVLTVTASNAVMCQADGFPTFAVTYTGFRAGDTENSLTTKPTVSTTANRNVAGTYSLVPANGVANNYSFVYVNGTLTINALPTANIVSNKGTDISKGDIAILTASGGTSYSWSTASGIISGQNTAVLTVRPAQTTTYTVRVTNASGCSSVATITIKVTEDYKVVANNILTPNGDGVNDTWFVQNIDMYPNNEVRIFDRNGRLMYNKKGYDNSWNGTIGGNELAEGTYYYIITYGPDKLVQKGFITIIRNR